MSFLNRDQQVVLLDLFIREAEARAKTGKYNRSIVQNFVQVLKETGFVLVLTEPGTDVADEAVGGE